MRFSSARHSGMSDFKKQTAVLVKPIKSITPDTLKNTWALAI